MKLFTSFLFCTLSLVFITSSCVPTKVNIPPPTESNSTKILENTSSPTPTQTIEPTPTITAIPADFPENLGDRAVFTYFFYWYDIKTKTHIGPHGPSNTDIPLTDEPPVEPEISWQNNAWFKQQIEDMIYAGIDVMLPVYWRGANEEVWAKRGLSHLSIALEEVRLSGSTPPSVAMFYDTSSASGMDLTEQANQALFYQDIHFFYETIPAKYWARTKDSRPIIWIFKSDFLSAYDQTFIDSIYINFENDFNEKPYLVFDSSWNYPTYSINGVKTKDESQSPLSFDASFMWGGSDLPKFTSNIADIGPGYDERWILSRNNPAKLPREDGNQFIKGWLQVFNCQTPWVAIETWNEFHEATDIAESIQYGRQYIDLSHKFSEYFKKGELPPETKLNSAFSDFSTISFDAVDKTKEGGIKIIPSGGDGVFDSVSLPEGPGVRMVVNNSSGAAYLYFAVDDGFYFANPQRIEIIISYYDEGYGPLSLEYDSSRCSKNWNAQTMYKSIPLTNRTNTLTWKSIKITLVDATFMGNQNSMADFRLATFGNTPGIIREISITKVP